MFELSARYYDKLYAFKDYRAETEKLLETLRRYKPSLGDDLLDVACGTGRHLAYLKESFRVEGLDLGVGMLEAARERLPEVTFHQADMTDFILGRQFDVVTCLFSSIGYVKTLEALVKTVNGMASHLVSASRSSPRLPRRTWFNMDRIEIVVPTSTGEAVFPGSREKWLLGIERAKMVTKGGPSMHLQKASKLSRQWGPLHPHPQVISLPT